MANNQTPDISGAFFMETGDWKTDFEKRTIYGIIANNASLCPNSGMRSRQELSMISEERVKELYHLAAFDEYENKKYQVILTSEFDYLIVIIVEK